MMRQIITSAEQVFTLCFPQNMIGKTIEVIAFEIEEPAKEPSLKEAGKKQNIKRIEEITKNSLVDLTTFKFDRDEANNYDK